MMAGFFDAAVAASLQFVTLPLEIIGFALALVEVRYPEMARRLAGTLAVIARPIARVRVTRRTGGSNAENALARSLKAVLKWTTTIGVLAVTAYFGAAVLVGLAGGEASVDWAIGQAVAFTITVIVTTVAVVIVTLAAYFGLTAGSDFIQRFVAGRAVGTLGIVIAGIGVLGECYQLATQILAVG